MFKLGSTIKDKTGESWVITQLWNYQDYLCVALMGSSPKMAGRMGGARFTEGSEVTVNKF